ncbi:MAG TPA: helix-hairpin-helix domain-containing protein [Sphingomonas sp.]|nr:helix-hairpin-helix domain-containing protein [Sphingomonas sp.]
MTASEFFEQYWPILAVVLAAVLLLVIVLRRGRGQRVTLTERDTSTRTLARPEAAPAAAPAPQLADSELTRLKGVGPKLAAALDAEGYGSLEKLAALSDAQQAELDAKLGTFAGRVQRDRLAEQARLLTSDPDAYAAAFGKGA